MDMILDGLFVSNYRAARDVLQLHRNKITHIVKLLLLAKPITTKHHYLCIRIADSNTTNISQYFSDCNDFIHDARLRKKNVLVHCYMGFCRSVTVIIAYVMTVTDLGFDGAWRVVRSLHFGARPNLYFRQQLQDFEVKQLMLERYRLRKRFPNSNLYIMDRLRCRAILKDYEMLLLERLRFNIDNHVVDLLIAEQEENNQRNEDGFDATKPAKVRRYYKKRLRTLARRQHSESHLIKNNSVVDMKEFKRTVLMPGAILYAALEEYTPSSFC